MARINFSDNFLAQQALFKSIKAKHTADAGASLLTPYLSQQGITMAALQTKATAAATHETAREAAALQAEKHRRARDNAFDPVFARLKGSVQYLKSFYRGTPGALADWGIQVNNVSKIVYPSDFFAQANLVTTFIQKHNDLSAGGGTSPLSPYLTKQNIDLTADDEAVTAAINSHTAMQEAADLAENKTALRDLQWTPVMDAVRGMAGYLKNLNSDNPKALGDWGITVDDDARPPRTRSSSLKIGASITIENATIGGSFNNVGATDLSLYRGKTATGSPTVVASGGSFGILKGWSVLTVVNPSTSVAGKFTIVVSNN